ncbi:MAG: hypothetical protein AB7Q69_11845 [Gemmatimonadales bacterium]
MSRTVWLILAGLSLLPGSGAGQEPVRRHVDVPVLAPRTEDASSVDGIIAAFYDVISGPAGQPRQWGRDRTLYIPNIRFVSMSLRDGKPHANVMDHQAFVDATDAGLVRNGFYEVEVHRESRSFGNIMQIFSTYEMRSTPDGPLIGRGINAVQLFYDGTRWWIASAVWDDETPGRPIPPEYLQ